MTDNEEKQEKEEDKIGYATCFVCKNQWPRRHVYYTYKMPGCFFEEGTTLCFNCYNTMKKTIYSCRSCAKELPMVQYDNYNVNGDYCHSCTWYLTDTKCITCEDYYKHVWDDTFPECGECYYRVKADYDDYFSFFNFRNPK